MDDDVLTWNGIQVGTAEAAGARCVTSTRRQGVPGKTYRAMVLSRNAPGPIMRHDPGFGREVALRHPDTGVVLYDLAEVERWNESRPGPGRWGPRQATG
jgi:hypothetical protein